MGPRTSIRGNRVDVTQARRVRVASMGPRTSIRGNSPVRAFPSLRASMGPRTSIRGNPEAVALVQAEFLASMGPRTSIRGNASSCFDIQQENELQWGRGLPSAETNSGRRRQTGGSSFNGAADFHPRKRPLSARTRGTSAGFNGAADFHPRKHVADLNTLVTGPASMGPRTSIRGNVLPIVAHAAQHTASMGPRTSIRGNSVAEPCP